MEDQSTQSLQAESSFETGRCRAQDMATLDIRTEHDPRFFTSHHAGLRTLGLALSDPKRLLILSLLAEEDRPLYGQEIAARLGVTPQTISHHLQILRNGGLVHEERRENAYRYYALDSERLRQLRETYFSDDRLGFLTQEEARQQVVEMFFQDGRLASIPVQRSKRRVILEEVARKFTWGSIYNELEVNAILKQIHDDVSSLRRYLVDEGIMLREQGRYWLVRPSAEHIQSDSEKQGHGG